MKLDRLLLQLLPFGLLTSVATAVTVSGSESFTFDGTSSPQGLTSTISALSGSDSFLVAVYAGEGSGGGLVLDSISWDTDGTNQAFQFGAREAGSNLSSAEIWYLNNPTSGAQDFTLNFSGTDFGPTSTLALFNVTNTDGTIDIQSFAIDSGGGSQNFGFASGSLAVVGGIANGGQDATIHN